MFLNLHGLEGVTSLKELIDNEFKEKKAKKYCKYCKKEVRGSFSRYVVALPKSLFIVVDRFDNKRHLKNLIAKVPKSIDLWDYLNVEN